MLRNVHNRNICYVIIYIYDVYGVHNCWNVIQLFSNTLPVCYWLKYSFNYCNAFHIKGTCEFCVSCCIHGFSLICWYYPWIKLNYSYIIGYYALLLPLIVRLCWWQKEVAITAPGQEQAFPRRCLVDIRLSCRRTAM